VIDFFLTIGHAIMTPLYYMTSGILIVFHGLFSDVLSIPEGGSWALSIGGTDPIDMEYKLADQVQKELTVVRLETGASLFRSLADGFDKASQIISGSRATD